MNDFFNPSNGKIYGKNLRWPSLYPGSTSNLNWYTITVEKFTVISAHRRKELRNKKKLVPWEDMYLLAMNNVLQ